jgi:hypothetical protein
LRESPAGLSADPVPHDSRIIVRLSFYPGCFLTALFFMDRGRFPTALVHSRAFSR